MARNLARADSSRARSGSSLRVTPVRRGAYGCLKERSERALKATSEVGIGGSATRVIEADVLPTSPGHGDACGALGGL